MEELLDALLKECQPYTAQGRVATYIPELAKGDPSDLGIYVLRSDGRHYQAGSYRKHFTIQSVVKPILLLLALLDNGEEVVRAKVGVEATGKPFDAINVTDSPLLSAHLNPMVNMGAIAICTLIHGSSYEERFQRLLHFTRQLAGNPEICEENADYAAFVAALTAIAEHMCAEHAGDGEGATHLITCEVTHAPDLKTARAVSRSVVCSNLFKAAVFGRDANWGRILCAIGYTPGDFSIDKVCVWLSSKAGEVYVCENAAYHPYSEDEAAKVLAEHDILVKVDMGTGEASAKAWGCDLTYDYVKINGDYRT